MWILFLEIVLVFFLFKQKTAYEMRISDWSSDVCSSDLRGTDSFAAAEQVSMLPKDRPAETVGRGIACADADGAVLALRQSRRQRKAAAGGNVFADEIGRA